MPRDSIKSRSDLLWRARAASFEDLGQELGYEEGVELRPRGDSVSPRGDGLEGGGDVVLRDHEACLEASDRKTGDPHLACGQPFCLCLRDCVMAGRM